MVFLLQILPDFSGVQSGFDRDQVKVRSIFGVPSLAGKMGKMSVFFSKDRHIAQNAEEEFVQYDLLSEKSWYKNNQLKCGDNQKNFISKSNSRRLQNQC